MEENMQRKFFALLAAFLILSAIPLQAGDAQSRETTLTITGMTCGGCVGAVKDHLKKTEGVLSAEVSLDEKEAKVTYDPEKTDPEKIAAAVTQSGFKAKVKKEKESAS